MSTTAKVAKLPLCDFCKLEGRELRAKFDFKTQQGPWANGCTAHWILHRRYADLGTGKGQKLVLDA